VTTIVATARPYGGEADLAAIADLQNACEAADQLGMGTSIDELRTEFADPRLDAARDLRLWEGARGDLAGFGQLWILESVDELDTRLRVWVHPAERGDSAAGRGIDMQIVEWAAGRLREAMRERGLPARLRTQVREDQAEQLALRRAQGFTIDRYSYTMARSLAEPIAEPRVPDGFTLREFAGPHEAERWVEMFNLSFIDHPNHHPWKAEQVHHYLSEPIYRQDLNLVAVAADGTLAGFCWATIYPEENARSGRSEGEIDIIGTRRGFRSLGLGRALLIEGLRRLKRAGMDTAKLRVAANNPTGALRLYESVDFRPLHTWMLHGKEV
jgi:mycothiol synthase